MLGLFRLTGAAAVAALLTAIPAEAAFVFTKVVDTFVAVPGGNGAKFILQGPWLSAVGRWFSATGARAANTMSGPPA